MLATLVTLCAFCVAAIIWRLVVPPPDHPQDATPGPETEADTRYITRIQRDHNTFII